MPPRKPDAAAASSVPSLVKDLVDQFDRPLDFYRELIQNSIDAGSNRIDVVLDYADNRAVIRVEDDGEGMDENIIDNYLLVLFRSTKENDFTKIGKFGIGFMSVFAPRPDMVRLWTAKNGQSWRLDFPSYKRYDKYRLSEPREGTAIELTKKMLRKEYDELAMQSRATISYWCKHSECKIFFTDKANATSPDLLTEPFDLPCGHALQYREEGTEVLLGFSPDDKPFCGFYNKGLTLKEEKKDLFPGVEFKAKSRYLEHTLTRDNVLEDENYDKLMKILQRLVDSELPSRLRVELEEISQGIASSAAKGTQDGKLKEAWARRLPFLQWLFTGYFSRWKRSDWVLFPSLSGKALSLRELAQSVGLAGGEICFDDSPNKVTDELLTQGRPVLASGAWVEPAGAWLSSKTVQASASFILPQVLPDGGLAAPLRGLLATLRWLDHRSGSKYRDILAADFDYPGSRIRDSLFVTQDTPGALSPAAEKKVSSLFWLPRSQRYALLSARHPETQRLASIHARKPGLAAYLALKMMHLHDGDVPPDQESKYCNLAEKVEARLLDGALRLDSGEAAAG